ncbi:MAG: ABC transporter ATP-binding protein [Planctomycetota bacterium]|nr:ABC transporter ATP-binding protein [Gemmataceae bacterium]MCY2969315.1 ABC transporter ATP-binding protein [Planctomycetota bacterium]MSR48474.1 ABC transporter ATP-binding protein [Gemmataceae bacterium]RLS61087.1 MAG: ABC transporter ATP-binding protein [Planctomycetota bacterium]RLS90392.1 MAG: ABC transporter ATP-binding protein [Planctomycetota bacterium]
MGEIPVIQCRNLSRRFGSKTVLNNVSFEVYPGIIGLLGPNGAGKSTLIKLILGLDIPSSGGITLFGKTKVELGKIGFMPEAKAIIPSMKGFEFVAFAGELEGLKRKDALRRSHEILDCLSMGEARFRKLGEYSTGMIQKVKLAQALVHDPELLILDEPTAGLDPPARNQMLDYLSYFARQQGKSIVLSTHLLGDVQSVCDQVVVLNFGNCLASCSLETLVGNKENRYLIEIAGNQIDSISALGNLCIGTQDMGGFTKVFIQCESTAEINHIASQVLSAGGVIKKFIPLEGNLDDAFFALLDKQRMEKI